MLHGDVISLSDTRRDIFSARWFNAPLDIGARKHCSLLGIQIGLIGKNAARLLPGSYDQRRLIAKGCKKVAQSVAQARCGMQVDEGRITGRLRITVSHADGGCLLEGEDIFDVIGPVVEECQFRRARVAEHL